VIGNPNPVRGRHIHDPELEAPLGRHRGARGSPWASTRPVRPRSATTSRGDTSTTPTGASSRRRAHPMELMLAFASFAAGGVLERHPRLRCAFLEAPALAAVVALAPGRGLGEVRARLECRSRSCRASTSSGNATSRPTPTRRCYGRWSRRSATTTSSCRRTIPTPTGSFRSDRGVRGARGRERQDQGQDPLGQLRAALQAERAR